MNRVQKFRKKPVTISAIPWLGDNLHDVQEFLGADFAGLDGEDRPRIKTVEGVMVASVGDRLIRGANGDHAVVPPSDFARDYDPA